MGINISGLIDPNQYIQKIDERTGKSKKVFFVLWNDKNTNFTTHTKNEIGSIEWFNVKQIQEKEEKKFRRI